jgi:hypothetical protein
MNKNLGILIGLGLDLNLFYSMSISEYEISLQADRSVKLENYLVSKGFVKWDYLYSDVDSHSEYKFEGLKVRVTLISKKK